MSLHAESLVTLCVCVTTLCTSAACPMRALLAVFLGWLLAACIMLSCLQP